MKIIGFSLLFALSNAFEVWKFLKISRKTSHPRSKIFRKFIEFRLYRWDFYEISYPDLNLLVLSRRRMISLKTLGRNINFIGNRIAETIKYFSLLFSFSFSKLLFKSKFSKNKSLTRKKFRKKFRWNKHSEWRIKS